MASRRGCCLFSSTISSHAVHYSPSSCYPRRPTRVHSFATTTKASPLSSPTNNITAPLPPYMFPSPSTSSSWSSQSPFSSLYFNVPPLSSHHPSVLSPHISPLAPQTSFTHFPAALFAQQIPSLLGNSQLSPSSLAYPATSHASANLLYPSTPSCHPISDCPVSSPTSVSPSLSLPKHLCRQPCQRLHFHDIFAIADTAKTAALLHSELPKRYAQRLQQVEALDSLWPGCVDGLPELKELRDLYISCIVDIWALNPETHSVQLNCVIRSQRRRHQRVVALLVSALRKVRSHFTNQNNNNNSLRTNTIAATITPNAFFPPTTAPSSHLHVNIEDWLDSFLHHFFLNRVSTELLREQYVAALDTGSPSGMVNIRCPILPLLHKAAVAATALCTHHMQQTPHVIITTEEHDGCQDMETGGSESGGVEVRGGNLSVQFPCVPCYIFSAAIELLKNALRATVEHHRVTALSPDVPMSPVKVIVKHTTDNLLLEVRDNGGGIPISDQPRVWSFTYTTAPPAYDRPGAFANNTSGELPPLAGCGVGLPLSRLYIQYIGGDVWLNSVPGKGTSACVNIRPLTDAWQEEAAAMLSATSSA
eukprot:GHVS01012185.1.p1 GENE.GHVS01012185.1~~GHVS01012185.1.p1  ORF type:complete len:618 (-),score=110.89 GHVS01012185.1:541-2313(-)